MMTGISRRSLHHNNASPGIMDRSNRQYMTNRQRLPCCVVLVIGVLVTTIVYTGRLGTRPYPTTTSEQDGEVKRQFLSATKKYYEESNLCYEIDDPEEWKVIPRKRVCSCPDPTIATNDLRKQQPEWLRHHQTMINDVMYEVTVQQQSNEEVPLDIVFLGDSITERWNGTRRMGTETNFPQFRHSFNTMFHKRTSDGHLNTSSTAQLQGMLLGSAGDISVELLWHMQNGVVSNRQLRPKVFMILIGTNDLGRSECSKGTVVTGILHVVDYLSLQYPETPIIVHGLLPRADSYKNGDYQLGRYWQDIETINSDLESKCASRNNWYYMDANDIFLTSLTTTKGGGGNQSRLMLNETLMSDSLHPDVTGYDLWGQKIVKQVLQIIS